jgi:site-specific recombinase XerD
MTAPRAIPARFDDSASGWERALYAFLAEKERRSGSKRTVQSYSRMLREFFGRLGKTPDQVTSLDVFAFAHGIGRSGREPSSVTVGARAACISSFYRFLIRMGAVTSNPCDALERPKTTPAPPRGLSAEQLRQLLSVIPDTPTGLRDRAIILTLVLTGRRRAELLSLKRCDITLEDEVVFYSYRGKGGKRGRRELPRPAYEAIVRALAAFGLDLADMAPDASVWPAVGGGGITDGTAYLRFRRYLSQAGLPLSGLHVLRHSAAKLRREAGESVESVSAFLDHSSLAVTTTYLRRLEGQEDLGWAAVAEAIGA